MGVLRRLGNGARFVSRIGGAGFGRAAFDGVVGVWRGGGGVLDAVAQIWRAVIGSENGGVAA